MTEPMNDGKQTIPSLMSPIVMPDSSLMVFSTDNHDTNASDVNY